MASSVLIVTTPDVPAIRAANRLLRLWERLQIDTPARVLLNRTSREHEIQPDFARRVLQAPVLDTTLPSGFRDLEEALNTGHPERLEQGAINRALADVAVAIEAVPAEGRRRRLRLRRAARATAGQTTIEMLGAAARSSVVAVLGLSSCWSSATRGWRPATPRARARGPGPSTTTRTGGPAPPRTSCPRAGATTPRSTSSRTAQGGRRQGHRPGALGAADPQRPQAQDEDRRGEADGGRE